MGIMSVLAEMHSTPDFKLNLKFEIAYDGSTFFGSQKQANKNTVEDELLKAFKNINIDTKIVLSGRTDKEVHANPKDYYDEFYEINLSEWNPPSPIYLFMGNAKFYR